MTILPISSPAPAPRETLYSYLARLAAAWRTDSSNLAYDMGASFKRLLNQDEEAFETLAEWAKLTPDVIEELLSWTGIRAGNVRMEFRGELFVSRALRNPVMRGCPVCLREDAAGAKSQAFSTMVMRGDWQFREVMLCVRHGHPLVPLWKATAMQDRFDIGGRLCEIEADILSGAFDRPERPPSGYDLWIDRRLESGTDDTWFNDQPLFVAAPICRLLGQAILKKGTSDDDDLYGRAHAVGFDVAIQGDAIIRANLDQIAANATRSSDEPGTVFGPLLTQLARDYLKEEGFDRIRDILRECILDHWPKAAGDVVLGEVVPERRLHSLTTAASETGIGAGVLQHFLIETGALGKNDDRPHGRQLFDAKAHAELLAEIPTLVGPIAMRKAMGATRDELAALADEGLLIPRTRVEKVKNPWRIPDGVALVAELSNGAVSVDEEDRDWETLLLATKRRVVTLAELATKIRDKRLTVGRRIGIDGLHGIVVLKSEVDQMASPRPKIEGDTLCEVPGTLAAAQFGRSVGLRDGGAFMALIEAGHVPSLLVMNPNTGRHQYRMTQKDIAAFHQRFVTLTTLSSETGQHWNTLKATLASGKVAPFSPEGQDFGPVYLRENVVRVIGRR